MKTKFFLTAACILLSQHAQALSGKDYFQSYSGYNAEGQKFLENIEIKTGKIALENGIELDLPREFYFLNGPDAKDVLEDAWGNPPGSAVGTLGMIFPSKYDPLADGNWGIEISFDRMGFVKDEDAASTNYDELLADMKSDTLAANAERVKEGYQPVELIGWASPPKYDQINKRLHWAKEIQFGTDPSHTLNYNVRFLGREGVLMMNYIAKLDQLPEIQTNLDPVLAMVKFSEGKRYSDFNPDIDTVAAVGIGGLIAGKIAAKAGLIALALVFLKKFAILLIAPVVWLGRKLKGESAES